MILQDRLLFRRLRFAQKLAIPDDLGIRRCEPPHHRLPCAQNSAIRDPENNSECSGFTCRAGPGERCVRLGWRDRGNSSGARRGRQQVFDFECADQPKRLFRDPAASSMILPRGSPPALTKINTAIWTGMREKQLKAQRAGRPVEGRSIILDLEWKAGADRADLKITSLDSRRQTSPGACSAA